MAVFPLFAPFRIYKNIHTQNFADNYLMLMPSAQSKGQYKADG